MMNEEALGWVIRTRNPEFDDWDAFTIWLEGCLLYTSPSPRDS